jgi:lipoate-protein ligase A
VADALARAFEQEHGLDLQPGGLTEAEAAQVETLARDKYATEAWLRGAP